MVGAEFSSAERSHVKIEVPDSTGGTLIVTIETQNTAFDAIACSPKSDGFTYLNGIVGRRIPRSELDLACQASIDRDEVCILPSDASKDRRVLIVPNAGASNAIGRQNAARLMADLFRATQTEEVQAATLLVTHFGCMRSYPQAHVLGTCDAIIELKRHSFLGLTVLGFDVAHSIRAAFERDVKNALVNENSF